MAVSTPPTPYFTAESAGLPLAQKPAYDRESKAGNHVRQGGRMEKEQKNDAGLRIFHRPFEKLFRILGPQKAGFNGKLPALY